MKTKLLLLFANVLLTVQLTRAQTTVQIGTVVSGGGCYFPVYNSTFETCSTCWITHVRANVLWTKAELSAAGIDSGATIISVEFAKRLIGGAFTVPVVFKMYMGNSNTTAFGNPITNPVSWASILASDSLVYSNSSFNLTTDVQAGAYRWIKWDVIPFVYKGSTLEIATELVMGSNVGSGTQIFWQRPSIPNPLGDKVIAGTGVGVAPDFLNSTLTTPMGRPNIRITYLAPASCPTPASITINNIAASSATISWPAVTGANDGYEYALTAGTTPPASGTAFSTTSVQATGLNSNTLYYVHVRTKCGTNFSQWQTSSFTTIGCPSPLTPTINLNGPVANISWANANGASGYQYAVSGSSTAPASGTAIATNSLQLTNLSAAATYYIHLRTDCGTGGFSAWTTASFTTSCFTPSPFLVSASDRIAGNASIAWRKVDGATSYEYAVLPRSGPPAGSSMAQLSDTVVNLSGLVPGLKYYFHVRSHCAKGTLSGWSTIEFHPGGIEIYPNPARDKITIKVYGQATGGSVFIYGAGGTLYKKLRLTANMLSVDISAFAVGVYLVKYENHEGYITRILKQ